VGATARKIIQSGCSRKLGDAAVLAPGLSLRKGRSVTNVRRAPFHVTLLALATLAVACHKDASVTSPRTRAGNRDAVLGAPTFIACATLGVALHGTSVDSVGISAITGGSCGMTLQISLGGTVRFDASRNVMQVPLVLHNAGSNAIASPARVYGWEDTLVVTSPPGLAHNKHTESYLEFVNQDSVIAGDANAFAGAVVWRLDSLLAPFGHTPALAPGASSSVKWIEISVKQGVHAFTAALEAGAAQASVPAAAVVIAMDTGVGGPAWTDTVAMVGDHLPYAFTPMTGYTNVQVRIDGHAAVASGTVVADADPHVITATADRVVTVPNGAEGVYGAARAVLTSTNPPAAFQTYLDSAYAYAVRIGEPNRVAQDLDDVDGLVFDYLTQQTAIRRVDSAIAGYSFRIGPDSLGDLSAPPFVDPSDTGTIIFNRGPAAQRSASRGSFDVAPGDTIEPTVFLYVNGIWSDEVKTAATSVLLRMIVSGVPGFGSRRISTYYHYNRTWTDQTLTPEEQRVDCVQFFGARLAGGALGANSFPSFMATCMQDTKLRNLSDEDIVESIRQVYDILTNTQAPVVDAVELANDIQHFRTHGRHVILVPHSQGNLVGVQAINFLSIHHEYRQTADSMCLGVVSLASPVDPSHFAVPPHQRAGVAVEGDLVPVTGDNIFIPRTSTSLSRRVALRGALLSPIPEVAALYLTWQGFTTLHYVNTSYLRTEAAPVVQADLAQVYGACTVHGLEPTQPSVTTQVGSRIGVGVNFLNSYGDHLTRTLRADEWSIADSTIVGPSSAGVFRGLAQGQTTVTAILGAYNATTEVYVVPATPPAIVGQWSGTWYSETDSSSFGTMQVAVSGNIFAMSATVMWTDQAGQVWSAFSTTDPTNTINDVPGLSSTARFWAAYKKPTEPNGFDFFRYFILTNPAGSTQATGTASDGSGLDTWQIQLTRVNQ